MNPVVMKFVMVKYQSFFNMYAKNFFGHVTSYLIMSINSAVGRVF